MIIKAPIQFFLISLSLLMISLYPYQVTANAENNTLLQERGEYPVFSEQTEIEMSSGHTVDVVIYYPGFNRFIDRFRRDQEAPFPVVIFSPGYGGEAHAYGNLVSDLASYGFIVAGVSWYYERNREMDVAHVDHSIVIDHIRDLGSDWRSPLYNLPDVNNCGAYGHSRGGRAAFMASGSENRIKAVCAWMPTLNNGSDVDQSCFKLLFAGADDEIAIPNEWTDPLYASCSPSIIYINVTGGDHSPEEKTHVDITFKFFRYHLLDDKSLKADLYGENIKERATSGEFELHIRTDDGEYHSTGLDIIIPKDDTENENEEKSESSGVELIYLIFGIMIFLFIIRIYQGKFV